MLREEEEGGRELVALCDLAIELLHCISVVEFLGHEVSDAVEVPSVLVLASRRDAPAQHAEGSWDIQVDSADNKNVIAQFKDANGQLLGFALTGQGTNEKQALQKQLPAILA